MRHGFDFNMANLEQLLTLMKRRYVTQTAAAHEMGVTPAMFTVWLYSSESLSGSTRLRLNKLEKWLLSLPIKPTFKTVHAELKRRGLKNSEVARVVGVVPSAVTHWVNGSKRINAEHLQTLVKWIDGATPRKSSNEQRVKYIDTTHAHYDRLALYYCKECKDIVEQVHFRDYYVCAKGHNNPSRSRDVFFEVFSDLFQEGNTDANLARLRKGGWKRWTVGQSSHTTNVVTT